jgi:hypothetical protein
VWEVTDMNNGNEFELYNYDADHRRLEVALAIMKQTLRMVKEQLAVKTKGKDDKEAA